MQPKNISDLEFDLQERVGENEKLKESLVKKE